MDGFAHFSSLSSMKYGRPSGPRHIIWDQVWIPCSHRGASFRSRSVAWGKGCTSRGRPSSSRWTRILDEMEVNMWLPDQISGPSTRWRSAINRVAMLRVTIEEHIYGDASPVGVEGHFKGPMSELGRSCLKGGPGGGV